MSAVEDLPQDVVETLVRAVEPWDHTEERTQAEILAWIEQGSQLYRVCPPADPPRHLAVYIALYDDAQRSLMMVDHRKAGAWLLPGGHVDVDEDPRVTVAREADEELQVVAKFHDAVGSAPLFLSVTETRGAGRHHDVTLWFVLKASHRDRFLADPREFAGTRWLSLVGTDWASEHFDPNMARFVAKLAARVSAYDGG
jgi:8-oxo-dGTP diphosphatase